MSVVSIEGFVHAVIIVDSCTGYRWLYGMKTKDGMLEVIKNLTRNGTLISQISGKPTKLCA
jgi:hypothetical protein